MKNKIATMYDKFLNRIHKERKGDAHVIVGVEIIFIYIALHYKFINSNLYEILKIENHDLLLAINIGLHLVLLIGLITTLCGILIKQKNNKE